jgi:hypothetical protein
LRACLLLRRSHYTRWRQFETGLKRLGFEITDNAGKPRPGDVLVLWNRHLHYERWARAYERAGAAVIVAENGWIGKIDDCKPIALARLHHNGAGWWPVGETDRWPRCGVELAPWRTTGEHILVLPQRGFGEPGVAMPLGWTTGAMTRLRRATRRKLVLRQHPGTHEPKDPDFSDVWAAVTWGSGAGIKALAAGIPVFYDMPNWIGAGAALHGIDAIETPRMDDSRAAVFGRLAWAQWSPLEIETGEPLARLIERAEP